VNTAEEILDQALQLPEKERAAIARGLLLSLDEPEISENEWNAEWAAEIQARSAAFERGETTARDWRKALADIRQSLREGR
jgi:hypothetical protein